MTKSANGVPSLTAEKKKTLDCLEKGLAVPFSVENVNLLDLLRTTKQMRTIMAQLGPCRVRAIVQALYPEEETIATSDWQYHTTESRIDSLERWGIVERFKDADRKNCVKLVRVLP